MLRMAQQQGWDVCAVDAMVMTEELEVLVADALRHKPEDISEPVTGKPRLEFRWKELRLEWQTAFIGPLQKAVDVYVDHDARRPYPCACPGEDPPVALRPHEQGK